MKTINFEGKGFKLIPGSLPTLYMPKKTIETPCPPPRHPPVYEQKIGFSFSLDICKFEK